jgi:hypothetical protein
VGDGTWLAADRLQGPAYRLCDNREPGACNWGIAADDPNRYCRSCRLTRTIPNLGVPGHRDLWSRLEAAKRQLLYGIDRLGLPLVGRDEDPQQGLVFDFPVGSPTAENEMDCTRPVKTGHVSGVITIDASEADPVDRTRVKQELGELYRTPLGHLRHEIGHYYWERLVRDAGRLGAWREVFGDETADYGASLRAHYGTGGRDAWSATHVSHYATAHPWEDWAETWAHYLHMIDAMETAASFRVIGEDPEDFDSKLDAWIELSVALNALNRSMGLEDAYPFVLTPAVRRKLRFVHDVVRPFRQRLADPQSSRSGT